MAGALRRQNALSDGTLRSRKSFSSSQVATARAAQGLSTWGCSLVHGPGGVQEGCPGLVW